LADESELYIFSDAAKKIDDRNSIIHVRNYIHSITGFKKITIYEASENKGLANSIIGGVSKIIDQFDKVIVLEDDLVTSKNFLNFMNSSLNYYESHNNVMAIAGYSSPMKNSNEYDIYFTMRASSWGWATWKSKWENIDWNISDYNDFVTNVNMRKSFNQMGSDMSGMLDKQMRGLINSWAIRWCYHQFKYNLYSVHPFVSKIKNIRFNNPDASNTKEKYNRFETTRDIGDQIAFNFPAVIELNKIAINNFKKPYTILIRAKYKILNSIG